MRIFHGITVKNLKALKLCDRAYKDRELELSARIAFHVTLTSVDSNRCDSHCLDRLLENLPAPPGHYGVFDVLPIRNVFAKAENRGSH